MKTKLEQKPSAWPKGLPLRSGPDPLLDVLKSRKRPLTPRNYLALSHPEGVPHPIPSEMMEEVPAELKT
jgi:hypothetical protein